jgi:PRC-barrel domain
LEAYYWNPPTQGLTNSPYPVLPYPVYVESSRPNIPDNFIALKEGARVLTEDGVHAGNLERLIMNPETEQATHFVISSGFLTKERKLLPAHWIKDVTEDEVHLSVASGLFDRLSEYPTRE